MKISRKILIVTPTLGTRQTLRETCKSVREFGADKVHHIVTCPQKAVKAVSAMVEGVEIVEEGGGKGVYGAVNSVLKSKAPNYEWVGYINDDDFWLPGMGALVQAACAAEKAQILYGRVMFVDKGGQPLFVSSCSGRFKSFPALYAAGIPMFTQQATLIRSDIFIRLGGFDEQFKLVADTDFWIRAIQGGITCRFIDQVCAAYRLQSGQLTSDTSLLGAEHKQLLKLHGLTRFAFKAKYEKTRFRIENWKLYWDRILRGSNKRRRVKDCRQ